MDHATTRRSTRARALIIAALSAAALAVCGGLAASASAESVWLCRPGLASNPCLNSEEATVELDGGGDVRRTRPAR